MLEAFKLFMITLLWVAILGAFTILVIRGHFIAGFFVFLLLFGVKYSDKDISKDLITQEIKVIRTK